MILRTTPTNGSSHPSVADGPMAGRKGRAEGRKRIRSRSSLLPTPLGIQSPPSTRRGITLIELLISIAIISILAALLVGVAARAGEVARDARTRSIVGRLHTLVIERYDLYRTRRVEPKVFADNGSHRGRLQALGGFLGVANTGRYPPGDPRIAAFTRLAAQRELMRVEMPDRWSDIIDRDTLLAGEEQGPNRQFAFLADTPTLWQTYVRRYNQIAPGNDPPINPVTNSAVTVEDVLTNQSAECLYLFVMNATGDGEAPSLFNESDIGDTDGDGALEFLDGWGQPIGFLRWAPGFESDAQWSVTALRRRFDRPPTDPALSPTEAVREAIQEDHDPLDVFRLDNPAADLDPFDASNDALTVRGWRLVPLIFSPGSDGDAGLQSGGPRFVAIADPYTDADPEAAGIQRLGQLSGDLEAYADNLHNHDVASLSTRR